MVAGKQHGHRHNGFEHLRQHLPVQSSTLEKRGGRCQFPTDDPNMVAVTPDAKNAGWAMSPDQECKPGSYCPLPASPEVSSVTRIGEIEKPFEGKGSPTVFLALTVLPGNEAMLIPTLVTSSATLAVPDLRTGAPPLLSNFYINPPGTGEEGCIWGTESEPIGNWSPYVAGADTQSNASCPDFGVEIQWPDGGCNGLPCRIDPAKGEGNVGSSLSAKGAGGAAFCVVTVQKGSTAQIVAFSSGKGSSGGDDDDDEETESSTAEAEPSTTAEAEVTTSEEPVVSTTKEPSTTAEPTTSHHRSTNFLRYHHGGASSTIFTSATSKTTKHKSTKKVYPTVKPEYLPPEETAAATEVDSGAAPTQSKENEAGRHQGNTAVAGLVVAFIAAACFF
ncbi:SUN family [Fusarium oxysporum f. sp. vasinfectum]|nr:SUN family [Fusarium oxysporum f. sp. vasinfectum]